MVIHHIHHHPYVCLVQRLNHLFEFFDTRHRIGRIGRVASFGNIVVQRIVAPVVFIFVEFGFVHRSIIIGRQQVNMGNAKFFQVINSGSLSGRVFCSLFGKCEEFALVFHSRIGRHGEIAHVEFVQCDIGNILQLRPFILFPSFGVCFVKIYNCSPFAVYTHCFYPHSGCFIQPFFTNFYLKSIKLPFQISRNSNHPGSVFRAVHIFHHISRSFYTIVEQKQFHFIGGWRPYTEF